MTPSAAWNSFYPIENKLSYNVLHHSEHHVTASKRCVVGEGRGREGKGGRGGRSGAAGSILYNVLHHSEHRLARQKEASVCGERRGLIHTICLHCTARWSQGVAHARDWCAHPVNTECTHKVWARRVLSFSRAVVANHQAQDATCPHFQRRIHTHCMHALQLQDGDPDE